jgi:hypothetical protein
MNKSLGKAVNKSPEGFFKIVTSIVPNYEELDIFLLIKEKEILNNYPKPNK